jgi:carbon monoxide dehydrogenase subunit G
VQIQETFTVDAPPDVVWRFFEDVERVARCVPGVQKVDVLGPDRYRVTATQKVGFISATFELTTTMEAREALRSLQLASVGKSVKGAIGDLRSRDRVEFEALPGGGTAVRLTSELAVGGMLGALGHKVIASKSREITEQFARALRAELSSAGRGAAEGEPSR